MAAQCSRLMYFIRGSVLHVWLNLMGQKALGQFFWHFKNAKAGIEGSCAATDRKRGGFWERLGLPLPINDGIEPKETARRETQGAHSWSTGVVVVGGGKHLKVKCCQEGVVGDVSPINDSSIHSHWTPLRFSSFAYTPPLPLKRMHNIEYGHIHNDIWKYKCHYLLFCTFSTRKN